MPRDKRALLNNNDDRKISTIYEIFRQKIVKRAKRSSSLFKAHSFAFVAINAFLVFLNYITPGTYPWFLYPLGGMSIILSLHYVSKNDRARQKIYLEKYPVLTDKALKLLKKIFRKRRFTAFCTMFSLSVSAFLFMVNIITGPGFLWASIPAAALVSLSGTIWFFNKQNKQELIEEFRISASETGVIISPVLNEKNTLIPVENNTNLAEAYSLQNSITGQLKQIGMADDPIIDTIPELVDNYILQIKTLLAKNEELSGILDSNSRGKLLKEKEAISLKMKTCDNEKLIEQYKTSLVELENHITAGKKIENHKEMLNLKINSALNSIRMLHLDLANLNVEKMSHNEVLIVLEKKSTDLSERLADLQSGYSELEKEMS